VVVCPLSRLEKGRICTFAKRLKFGTARNVTRVAYKVENVLHAYDGRDEVDVFVKQETPPFFKQRDD
jgi:hypothetical protein